MGEGMAEGKLMGVEGSPGNQVVIFCAVEKIANQGMPQVCHVDSDLMGATGLQFQLQERAHSVCVQHFIVRSCGLSIRTDLLCHKGAIHLAKRCIHNPCGGFRFALAHGQIDPAERGGVQLLLQKFLGIGMLGRHQKAGGAPIQTVDRVKIGFLLRCFVIMDQEITQRIGKVAWTGMNRQAGGFVKCRSGTPHKSDLL